MKFLVDAQLPRSLAALLRQNGFDVVHTSELPDGNDTSDPEISRLSVSEERIVVSKDGDFYNSFTANKEPYKLLHIRTGNISNGKLLELFSKNMALIIMEIGENDVVEIRQHHIIAVH